MASCNAKAVPFCLNIHNLQCDWRLGELFVFLLLLFFFARLWWFRHRCFLWLETIFIAPAHTHCASPSPQNAPSARSPCCSCDHRGGGEGEHGNVMGNVRPSMIEKFINAFLPILAKKTNCASPPPNCVLYEQTHRMRPRALLTSRPLMAVLPPSASLKRAFRKTSTRSLSTRPKPKV